MKHPARVRKIARDRFGFSCLRPGQEEAIVAILEGHDILAVMPAGAGKSAIYQIPALMLPGPTVVVSPAANLGPTVEPLDDPERELLFLTPEHARDAETLDRLRAARPSLFVVMDAHRMSRSAEDFRADYLPLRDALAAVGRPIVVALTACAGRTVRDEIVTAFEMRDPRVIVRGFDRPNISLAARPFADEGMLRAALLGAVDGAAKPGIVYAPSRRHAEELTRELGDRGVRALFDHEGLTNRQREQVELDLARGVCDVIVAPSSFPLAIERPDVRFAFHYGLPDSLESYHQEIGRAGRDGENAAAVLFYRTDGPRTGMKRYAELVGCRREYLLRHFGEDTADRCGNCDYCVGKGQSGAPVTAHASGG